MTQTQHDLNQEPGSVTFSKKEMITLKIQGNSPDTVLQRVTDEEILKCYPTNFTKGQK